MLIPVELLLVIPSADCRPHRPLVVNVTTGGSCRPYWLFVVVVTAASWLSYWLLIVIDTRRGFSSLAKRVAVTLGIVLIGTRFFQPWLPLKSPIFIAFTIKSLVSVCFVGGISWVSIYLVVVIVSRDFVKVLLLLMLLL